MRFINLTPHAITEVISGQTFPPSGAVVRVASESTQVDSWGGCPVHRVSFGAVEGLPSPQVGTVFIVSALVRQATPERGDLVSPGALVRDENGNPIGCQGFNL